MPTKEHIAKMNSVPKTYHKKFNDEQVKDLVELNNKGMSGRKIALIYGASPCCVRKYLKIGRTLYGTK